MLDIFLDVSYPPLMRKPPANPAEAPAVNLAESLAAALPPPKQSRARTVKVLLPLSEGERDTIARVAKARDEPFAVTLRTLAVTYAQIILGERK